MNKTQIIALYLPQFYPFPENDEWWGKGFTEWTNVGKAKPMFNNHYQPKIPADLGYYDLRLPIVREEQAELAKEAGIHGFCYWHYWFGNGKRLMSEVFDEVLITGKPDFPFCLAWANHSWYAKNWNINDTKGKDRLLIEQKYLGVEDYRMHFNYVLKAFKDERYIKVDGKPLFKIYDSHGLPDDFINLWNKWAKECGFPDGIYFVGNIYYNENENDYLHKGYSAVIKSRLKSYYKQNLASNIWGHMREIVNTRILHRFAHVPEYKEVINSLIDEKDDAKESVIPTLVPNFDHSPRSGRFGLIYKNSTPELFGEHVKKALNVVKEKKHPIIFLRSWNEWGEGNYMEPDLQYKKGYIEALKKCLEENSNK
jgi:hypothetical protein